MKNSIYIIVFILIAIVSFILGAKLYHEKNQYTIKTTHVVDTIIIIDTLVEYKTKYITKKVIDTLYLPSDTNKMQPLPIEQKYYSKTDSYDAWVSGYKPQLDSIRVYNKVEYKTITNTITKEIEYNRWNLYTYMGFKHINDKCLPSIGLMTKSPKSSIYMIEIGIDNNKDLFFGVNVGYKLK